MKLLPLEMEPAQQVYPRAGFTKKALALALVAGLAACSPSGPEKADKAPSGTDRPPAATEENEDFEACALDAMIMVSLDPEKLNSTGQELNIAFGFNFLSETVESDGTRGIERLENPLVTECENASRGTVDKVLSTGVLGDETGYNGPPVSPLSATGVAFVSFFPDGSYGVSVSGKSSIVTTKEHEEMWIDGMLDPEYVGSKALVKASPATITDKRLEEFTYDTFHPFVANNGEEVMKRTFYPNMSIEQVSEMIGNGGFAPTEAV